MRMGWPPKLSHGWRKAGWEGHKPKHITSDTFVGQVSPDLISTYFGPKTKEAASESLIRYAEQVLEYEDALSAFNKTKDADIGVDGSIETELPLPPATPVFHSQHSIDEWSEVLQETSQHFFSKSGGWKVHVNAAKLERTLDERYGIFRPFITQHPEVERFVRSMQRKYHRGHFGPFRKGPPPIPRSTAIILLIMMQRGNLGWQVVTLAALFFLVGLQPWALVLVVSVLQGLLHKRKRRTIGKMTKRIPTVQPYYLDGTREECLLKPVGMPLANGGTQLDTTEYDTIMIGSGPSTLYPAALMSRAGRRVLVLSSAPDASGCLTFQAAPDDKLQNITFDVHSSNIARISRQQDLLAPALATKTDSQGGIRFAKIGTEADGYAFEILSIPGVGTERRDQEAPFILKALGGRASFMEDTATYLGDNWPGTSDGSGDSVSGQYVQACDQINASASLFYLSKVLPDYVNRWQGDKAYQKAALRNCAGTLNRCFQLNAHLRSLFAGIGMKAENITPSHTSMAAHVSNLCGCIGAEGMHYPVGGPRALSHALASVIEQCGGRVVRGAPAIELIFDESIKASVPKSRRSKENEPQAPFCVGVKLASGQVVRFSPDRYNGKDIPVVISNEGFIHTFIRLLPDDIRTSYKVPRGIPALAEQRPVVHFLLAFGGSSGDLSITGADFYRLPGAAIAIDEVDPATGEVKCGEMGWSLQDSSDVDDEQAVVQKTDTAEASKASEMRPKKKRPYKFEAGRSWIRVSFPSAKDPSFEQRHGKLTTCVVTVEADDELVTPYDTKPKIFVMKRSTPSASGELQRLLERVKKDLFELYPQLEDKLLHAEIRGPFQKGLSHTPERYVAKGIRTDTPYPGLYMGGSDLTVGDSFSGATVAGWMVANTVCGYGAVDYLFLEKDVVTDLEQFLELPILSEEEDVAVPFTPQTVSTEEDTISKDVE